MFNPRKDFDDHYRGSSMYFAAEGPGTGVEDDTDTTDAGDDTGA